VDVLARWEGGAGYGCPVASLGTRCFAPQVLKFDPLRNRVYFDTTVAKADGTNDRAFMYVSAYGRSEPTLLLSRLPADVPLSQLFLTIGNSGELLFSGIQPSPSDRFGLWEVRPSSSDGSIYHKYLLDGRISETREAVTERLVRSFEYDSTGLLTGILDETNRRTQILREAGRVTQVISPDNVSTSFDYDTNGRLTSVTDPDNGGSAVTYHGDTHLMRSFTNRASVTSWYEYDSRGRLSRNWDSEGYLQLTGTDANTIVKSDADGRVTQYVSHTANGVRTRYVRLPDGTTNSSTLGAEGTEVTTLADGTVITSNSRSEPLLHDVVLPTETTVRLPSGLTSKTTWSRVVAANGNVTTTRNENGNAWVDAYSPTTRTWTFASPEQRVSTTVLDALGRSISTTYSGRANVSVAYNEANGRLLKINAGTVMPRNTTFSYDARGGVEQIASTDASSVVFQRDLMGLPVVQTTAGNAVHTDWSPLGELRQVTTPAANLHDLTYSGRRAVETYTPPTLPNGTRPGLLTATYTAMGEPRSLTLANGSSVTLTRDSATSGSSGKVKTAVVGGITYTYGYHPQTGQRTSITGSDGTTLTTAYDGSLVTSTTWGGSSSPVAGTVGFVYNNNFLPSTLRVNGQQVASFTYDRDRLMTASGSLVIARSPQTGDVSGTTLGQVTTTSTYSEHGEPALFRTSFSGASVFEYNVTQRDGQGRILELSETANGTTTNKGYRYDALARLRETLINGVTASVYTYDANGNRETRVHAGATDVGIYDAQDRITSYGDCAYELDAAGFVTERDCGAGPEMFVYDARGSLRSATLANGTVITYMIDPLGRRIGRRVNGALDKGWLYLDGLRPVAQVNSAGQLEAVYLYGTRANVPDTIIEKTASGDALYRVVADHLGSPRRVLRVSDGAVVHELDFDEWGNVLREAGSKQDLHPFGFAGGLRDRDTGLVRFGARDYEPVTGRWTARDPVLFEGGDTNLYAYAGSDPMNWVDPDGLEAVTVSLGGTLGLWEVGAAGAGTAAAGLAAAALGGWYIGDWLYDHFEGEIQDALDDILGDPFAGTICQYEEHKKNKRKGNKGKHEKGQTRKGKDKPGGEKGDERRPYQR
jgi:RHS repeat-associated protein